MSTGAWIFLGFVLIAIVLIALARQARRLPDAPSDAVERLLAAAQRASARSGPVDVDWTGKTPPPNGTSVAAEADSLDPTMPIRTIGTPQPGDESMKSEQQAATKVVVQEMQRAQGNVLSQLDILRQTRAARGGAGSVRVPINLAAPIIIPGDDSDVEKRG